MPSQTIHCTSATHMCSTFSARAPPASRRYSWTVAASTTQHGLTVSSYRTCLKSWPCSIYRARRSASKCLEGLVVHDPLLDIRAVRLETQPQQVGGIVGLAAVAARHHARVASHTRVDALADGAIVVVAIWPDLPQGSFS